MGRPMEVNIPRLAALSQSWLVVLILQTKCVPTRISCLLIRIRKSFTRNGMGFIMTLPSSCIMMCSMASRDFTILYCSLTLRSMPRKNMALPLLLHS
jgi:hypothetical protein